MLKPLEQWYCDVCGEIIERPKDGYVIWKREHSDTELGKEYGFKIIHQNKCDKDRQNYPSSMHLDAFLGHDGMAYLLSFLSIGPVKAHLGQTYNAKLDMDEFVDFFRRLQVPNYEEARRRFSHPDFLDFNSDNNEVGPYVQSSLIATINNPAYLKEW